MSMQMLMGVTVRCQMENETKSKKEIENSGVVTYIDFNPNSIKE